MRANSRAAAIKAPMIIRDISAFDLLYLFTALPSYWPLSATAAVQVYWSQVQFQDRTALVLQAERTLRSSSLRL
jgi:hypothetical protein